MKKIVSLIASAFLLTTAALTQNSVEITGGMNIANLTIPDNLITGAVWSSRYGFVFGSAINLDLSGDLSLSPGIRFIQKGVNSVWPFGPGVTVHGSTTNNYLELPVYLKYRVYESDTRLFIVAGPTYSSILSSHAEATSEIADTSHDSKSEYKSYDVSFDLGLRTETTITPEYSFLAGVIFSRGLVRISAMDKFEQSRDVRVTIGISRRL